MKGSYRRTIFTILILALLSFVIGGVLGLWQDNEQLPENEQVKENTAALNQATFIESDISGNGDFFAEEKATLKESKKDFIAINLKEMKAKLYEEGELSATHPVLSKGEDGSWWETPTGSYEVLSKEANQFSSLGEVWMPWSIKFYGNFYIHGWPYYPSGSPVRESFSGGCIRLSNEVAKTVFEFAEEEMPILIKDSKNSEEYSRLSSDDHQLNPPQLSAESVFVADPKTGEVLLNKKADSVKPVASLTKLMSAVVASEVIYLERGVIITEKMMRDSIQSYSLQVGANHRVFNLLYPFLQQSSNGAGRAIATAFGEEKFIEQMNKKANSLDMDKSNFVEPNGVDQENTSTLKDMFKLAKYILEKRYFLYDISKGEDYHVFGPTSFANIETYNEFHDNSNLVGAKNGQTEAAGETYASVWNFEHNNEQRFIFIGILGSQDRQKDVEEILDWLKDNFELK